MNDLLPNIGVGVAKILFRALGRSATSAVDKLITGPLERSDAKRRAQSEIDLRIIAAVGDKMVGAVEELSPQELAQLTDSSSRRSVLKQLNHNRVVQLALDRLTPETTEKQQEPISDELLDSFEPIAENQSTEEMQALFARILAGEIQKPGSFSKRSLRMAEQLDRPTAELFQRLCSMALVRERFLVISGGVTLLVAASQLSYSKIVCSLHGLATRNTLEEFGLDFTRLNRLAEYGLIIPSINMQQVFDDSIVNGDRGTVERPIYHQGRNWALREIEGFKRKPNVFKIQGVGFSTVGHELCNVAEQVPTPDYDGKLIDYLRMQGFRMVGLAIDHP